MPEKSTKKIDAAAAKGRERKKDWYNLTLAEAVKKAGADKLGLTPEQAVARRERYGFNVLPAERPIGGLILLLRQFKNSLIYILLAAAGISLYLGDRIDAGVIMAAVVFNVLVGFFQEYKAQHALQSLRRIITYHAWVVRGGKERLVSAAEILPGDIVIINSGSKIPADGRLLEAEYLRVNESVLTGEAEPCEKITQALSGELIVADQHNMVFMGTVAAEGRGKFMVTATGLDTEIGKIADWVRQAQSGRTPLQKKLDIFSRNIGFLVLGLSVFLFLAGIYLKYNLTEMFNTAVAVAVAAIPEGLAVGVTAILAIGMQRILRKGSLVRQLVAAETLGSTTVICVDKTGTITLGEMRVARLLSQSHDIDTLAPDSAQGGAEVQKGLWELRFLHRIGLACNNAVLAAGDKTEDSPAAVAEPVAGSPTEKAILLSALDAGFDYHEAYGERPRFDEVPFDSDKKFMATLNRWTDKQNIIYLKGAPEKILNMSSRYQVGRTVRDLSAAERNAFLKQYEKLSRSGLRVLAGAYKGAALSATSFGELPDFSQDIIFVGFWGIKDPIRSEVKDTLHLTKKAGIRTIMITGDNKHTAAAIAREAGLDPSDGRILEDKEIAGMSESELARAVKKIEVFARATPRDKLRIVEALQKNGEVVAMTGDGVNDAPALQRADIGVALGSGTDVAKETADLVLLDNNVATIVAAVREGRVIYDNIRKTILFLLAGSFAEMTVIAVSLLLGWPVPLLAAQILWINLVTDTFPNLALTQEPEEAEVMSEFPRDRGLSILDFQHRFLIGFITVTVAGAALGLFYLVWRSSGNVDLARTVAFTTIGVASLLYVFSARSVRRTIFEHNFFANRWLLSAVGGGFVIQLAGIYLPFFQSVLRTVSLGLAEWLLILLACFWLIILIELVKYFFIVQRRAAVGS